MNYRTCYKCDQIKELTSTYWPKSNQNVTGLAYRCKQCQNQYSKDYYRGIRTPKKSKLLEEGKRKCSHCKEIKALEAFKVDKGAPAGRGYVCKMCSRELGRTFHYNRKIGKDTSRKEKLGLTKSTTEWLEEIVDIGEVGKVEKERVKRNQDYICEYLSTHPCVDCGQANILYLEFDHLRDKTSTIAMRLRAWSIKRLDREIEKCEVVCSYCHTLREAYRRNFYRLQWMQERKLI